MILGGLPLLLVPIKSLLFWYPEPFIDEVPYQSFLSSVRCDCCVPKRHQSILQCWEKHDVCCKSFHATTVLEEFETFIHTSDPSKSISFGSSIRRRLVVVALRIYERTSCQQ